MLKVFIVDDDDIIRQGLQFIVNRFTEDCEIVGQASDGEMALELIKLSKPDLLITDIKMPIMDGIELIKNIKELDIKLKIIVLSGFDEYKYVRETFKYGVKDYLLKPIQKKDIIEIICKIKLEIDKEKGEDIEGMDLQLKAKEGTELLREKLLIQLVNKRYTNNSELEDKLNNLDIKQTGNFILAKISIDDYFKLGVKKLQTSAINCIRQLTLEVEIMCRIVEGNFRVLKYLESSNIIVLFESKSINIEDYGIELKQQLLQLQKDIFNKNGFTVTIGISKEFHNIFVSDISLEEASLANDGKFYKGSNLLFNYEDESYEENKIEKHKIDNYIKNFVEAIEVCNSKKATKYIEEFLLYLKESKVSPDEFRKNCTDLIGRISATSSEFRDAVNDCYVNDEFDFNFYLKEINTYAELIEWLSNEIFRILEEIKSVRVKKSKKVIEISKKYVLSNFKDDITLNLIAEKVFLNPNYFSNLFKSETDMNFSDFLLEVRINEAKKYLANHEYKIYEIGPMVGYDETVSFGRAFKKKVGLSPSDYRNIIK